METPTSEDIASVNQMLDTTTPMVLNTEVVALLNNEPYNVSQVTRENLSTALNELLRREKVDFTAIAKTNVDLLAMEERLANVTRTFSEYRSKVIRDFERISESLNDSADENNLCEEYDDAIDKANGCIQGTYRLDGRTKEFTVTITVTASVTARNDEAAQSMVEDDLDSYVDWSYADYHVEED